jgi:hypothetical protein
MRSRLGSRRASAASQKPIPIPARIAIICAMSLSVLKVEPLRDDRQQTRRHHFRAADPATRRSIMRRPGDLPAFDLSAPVPIPRPSIRATPARTASRLPVVDSMRSASEPMTDAPAVRPKPATASGDRPPPAGVTKPRTIAPASATAAADRAKPVADAQPSSASPAARSVAPTSSCYYPGIRVPPVWDSSRSMWVEVGACEYPLAEPGLKAADWSR